MKRCIWWIPALCLAAPVHLSAGFIITPEFGTSITGDPNSAAIESVIATAIAFYEATFTNNMDVAIDFDLMTAGLGESQFGLDTVSYSAYRSALVADQSGVNDAIALAHLQDSSSNPVTGTGYVNIKPATEAALGMIDSSPSSPVSGGNILLNASLTTTGGENSSGNEATGPYSLLATTEHEIDEILGLGSTLGLGIPATPTSTSGEPSSGNPSPEDLFRYDSSGNRSFTAGNTSGVYFSLDGTTRLGQFDNQGDGGDYGDWQSNPLPNGVLAEVQDAFASPGSSPYLTVASPEITALDVIGYTTVAQSPEPSTGLLAWGAVGAAALFRRVR